MSIVEIKNSCDQFCITFLTRKRNMEIPMLIIRELYTNEITCLTLKSRRLLATKS